MDESRPHLKALEEIERMCMHGLVDVMRAEGIEGSPYASWDTTGRHRDYGPAWRSRATVLHEGRPGGFYRSSFE